jgi:hypothetical protein
MGVRAFRLNDANPEHGMLKHQTVIAAVADR